MSLYEKWLAEAYNEEGKSIKKVWDVFLPKEQKIYEYILSEKVENISGTVSELAQKFDMTEKQLCGFISGINGIRLEPYDMEVIEPDTEISIDIDFEKLYKKMVEYKAEHLYNLPEWEGIFAPEEQKELYRQQKNSSTYTRGGSKVGRNDPCVCGSGKKYKKCCGR